MKQSGKSKKSRGNAYKGLGSELSQNNNSGDAGSEDFVVYLTYPFYPSLLFCSVLLLFSLFVQVKLPLDSTDI